jgi:hypothetical protein
VALSKKRYKAPTYLQTIKNILQFFKERFGNNHHEHPGFEIDILRN